MWQLAQFVSCIKIFISPGAKIAPALSPGCPQSNIWWIEQTSKQIWIAWGPNLRYTLLQRIISSCKCLKPEWAVKKVLTFIQISHYTQTVFVSIPQLRLLQAARLNFYGYEKPRVRVFCSECFWSRPGLSQCENLLVIDCYTPTVMSSGGASQGLIQKERHPWHLV